MAEFRHDPLTGRWLIVAEERAARPNALEDSTDVSRCPFCAGNEVDTPSPLAVYPDTVDPLAWLARVVPNKFPAVGFSKSSSGSSPFLPCAGLDETFSTANATRNLARSRFHTLQPGEGAHEVIIESGRHVTSITELTTDEANWSFVAYRDRLAVAASDPRLRYGIVFKNCRRAAGATLEHAHSQFIATALIPAEVKDRQAVADRYWAEQGRCLSCDLLAHELAVRVRIIATTNRFILFCPFASRFPYEAWLFPREHAARFEATSDADLRELAGLIQRHVRALESIFPLVAYNFWIQSPPFQAANDFAHHWHVVIIPRISMAAGYEWGTGCFVNPVAPDTAANLLRHSDSLNPLAATVPSGA